MKKIFLCLVTVSMIASIHASGWQEHWIEGLKFFEKSEFDKCEEQLNLAIAELEAKGDITHPNVYIDRAKVYSIKNRNKEVIEDVDKAFKSPYLLAVDRVEGCRTRMSAYAYLGLEQMTGHVVDDPMKALSQLMEVLPNVIGSDISKFNMMDAATKDLNEYMNTSTHLPKIERTKEMTIIRNAPEDPRFKDFLFKLYSIFDECESRSDIEMINPSTYRIKTKNTSQAIKSDSINENGCECGCNNCGGKIEPELNVMSRESDCKWACDASAACAGALCGRIRNFGCQGACMLLVTKIRDECVGCCESGNFYITCVSKFVNFMERFAGECPACGPAIPWNELWRNLAA